MSTESLERLRAAVEGGARLLPLQGPIHSFVHHNTLHALQHRPFHDALAEATERLETFGYLSEAHFRGCYASGRITDADLRVSQERWARTLASEEQVLLGDGRILRRGEVHWVMLHQDLSPSEDDAYERSGAHPAGVRSHRDLLLRCTGEDPALLVNTLMIRLAAAYLDQGTAVWSMPDRERGFFTAFLELMRLRSVPTLRWARGVRERAEAFAARQASSEEALLEALEELGVSSEHHEGYIERVLLELPGWAGMFRRLERNVPERGGFSLAPSLMDYLAVRLCLAPLALREVARETLGFDGDLAELFVLLDGLASRGRPSAQERRRVRDERVREVARLASGQTEPLDPGASRVVQGWLDEFPRAVRQRIWHEAYEGHYRDEVLDALRGRAAQQERAATGSPRFQVVFCIDDRAESIRRHLEECAADVQTLGTAGFFGFAVAWRGLDDPRHVPSCPVAVQPFHEVTEVARTSDAVAARRRSRRARWARMARRVHGGTRSLEAILWAPLLGLWSAVPALLQVLFPRSTAALTAWLHGRLVPALPTRLVALRDPDGTTAEEGTSDGLEQKRRLGLSIDEAVERTATVLEDLGLVGSLAPLVLLLGHGSRSRNNPHASAYDCGACGGRHGGPNARLFALVANDPRVREGLRRRGIVIPPETVFLGGQHDTTRDAIDVFDLDLLPDRHRERYAELSRLLEEARSRNAHERCRRFERAPRRLSPRGALRHVEARAHALAEPRPELGHATNALCVIGRRTLTRGLFLDRRAFLVDYDPRGDAGGAVLQRILGGVVPVGAGISLEYYFSRVDNDRFGCGSKLAHNVAAGIGVIDGAESDLRTGLPWQMVELHEPLRLLVVVEAEPEVLLDAVSRHAEVRELVFNEWIRLCAVQEEPSGVRIQLFDPEHGFVPQESTGRPLPRVSRSAEWYRDQVECLPPAFVAGGAPPANPSGGLRHAVG